MAQMSIPRMRSADGWIARICSDLEPAPAIFLAAAAQLGVHAAEGSRGFVFNVIPLRCSVLRIGTSLTVWTPYRWMEIRPTGMITCSAMSTGIPDTTVPATEKWLSIIECEDGDRLNTEGCRFACRRRNRGF